jgi:hypothetical protein
MGYLFQFLVEECEAQLEGLKFQSFILFIHKLEGIFQKSFTRLLIHFSLKYDSWLISLSIIKIFLYSIHKIKN